MRDEDPVDPGAARVSPAGDERGCSDVARVLSARKSATAISTPASARRSSGCSSALTFCFASKPIPSASQPGRPIALSDVELASRLSFFLWSSIPDDELLDLAIGGKLREAQRPRSAGAAHARRPRARAALVDNFFGQWLQTRNVWLLTPDANTKFPWFDDNLRTAFVKETELFLDDQLKADRGIADLLTADYTFLNEQLARHYGMSGVYGSHFRRVTLATRIVGVCSGRRAFWR